MGFEQSTVKPLVTNGQVDWKGSGIEMTDFLGAAAPAFLFIGPFIVLAIGAALFGVDSRPGIDDAGPRRWMP
jgi:hypothetical protein